MAKREKTFRVGAKVYFVREVEPGRLILWDGRLLERITYLEEAPHSTRWRVSFKIGQKVRRTVELQDDLWLDYRPAARHLIFRITELVRRLQDSLTRALGYLE